MFKVTLSRQDLAEFLDGNGDYMEQYRGELEKRLARLGGSADVEISRNALQDKLERDGEPDDGTIVETMNRMVNDWSWLKQ